MAAFKSMLIKKSKNTPYREALSHILVLHELIQTYPEMGYGDLAKKYSSFSDREIIRMADFSALEGKEDALEAINSVKGFLSRTLGPMAYAQRGVLGGNNVYDEFLDLLKYGYESWADVLADCEGFVRKI
ncbi:MAG: hypothetical protein ABIG96_01500 [Candidatus Micrarchaeota archaeon]